MTLGDSLRHLGLSAGDDPRADGELLTAFVRQRDETAFAELLRRHGPTVLGVCRRVLGNSHDADDAFQAAFLVLARKAESVRPPGMVGNWLYGVAVRTANKARVMNAKRVSRERESVNRRREPTGEADAETRAAIDAELSSLPDVYRAAFVACDLNGRSRSEAARELGWPEGTVAARLAKARELLASRLRKRGVTLAAGALAAVMVPPALATDTLAAVRELAAVGAANGVAPAAQQLSDEVVKAMTPFNWKLIAAGVLSIGLAAGTAALIAAPSEKSGPRPERRQLTNAPVPKPNTEWKEAKPITFDDGGRVTCVAYSPSGEIIAICRDTGAIHFLKAKTRERLTEMAVKPDPKTNPNTEVGTVTTLAFRPTPHKTLGDVFAVTHKNGVAIGTYTQGLVAENTPPLTGVPTNWALKDLDPHQVAWVGDGLVATNGVETHYRSGKGQEQGYTGWDANKHKPSVLAVADGVVAFTFNNGWNDKPDPFDFFLLFPDTRPFPTFRRLSGHKARPTCAAVAKDGKRVVTADEGGTLIAWDGETFKEKSRIEQGPTLAALALAPDGKTVAVLRTHGVSWLGALPNRSSTVFQLYVFDVTAPPAKLTPIWASETRALPGKLNGPVSLAFSPDGKTLLAAFSDPYTDDKGAKPMGVRVWELVPKK